MAKIQSNKTHVHIAQAIDAKGVVRYTDEDGQEVDFRSRHFSAAEPGDYFKVQMSQSKQGRRWLVNAVPCTQDGTTIEHDGRRPVAYPVNRNGDSGSKVTEVKEEVIDPFGPEVVEGFYYDREARMVKHLIGQALDRNTRSFIWIKGPSGYGKTTLPRKIAKSLGVDFLLVPCALMSDPEEWYGMRVVEDGSTGFVETDFSRAVQNGNVIILLDEANRIKPWITNSLLQLLDDTRETTVQGRVIKVGQRVVFAMTTNIGYQYAGTDAIDAAFSNRVTASIEVRSLPYDIENKFLLDIHDVKKDCEEILTIITKMRDVVSRLGLPVDVSTRTSKNVATLVSNGLSVSDAFTLGVINHADDEFRKALIDVVKSVIRTE